MRINKKRLASSAPLTQRGAFTRLRRLAFGGVLGLTVGAGSAFGNPVDPTVSVGSASFETVGNQLNISNSPGAIIDWQNFSIAQGEITRFIQESGASAVLNRVTGGNLSEILGELQSNGQVFLINPAGLVVGDGAVIDTAGFVGSTLDISNESFRSGNYLFTGDSGAIENRGLIHVTGGGDIALIATSVENSGILRSDNGDILLAAGRSVSMSFDGLDNVNFDVQAPENEVLNLGNIIAGGGHASLLGGRIRSSGDVEVVASPNGKIFLQATDLVEVSGDLTASTGEIHVEGRQVEIRGANLATGDDTNGSQGGDIRLLGDNVGIFSGSKVDATGASGGGTILIGGEQQGQGDTRTSEFVYLDENASVSSNGGVDGDGGTVILFAENSARVAGALTARGGTASGDGGFIETSGLLGLSVTATPDAGASNGAAGEWLIDPIDIRIFGEGVEEGIAATPEGAPEVFTAVDSGASITVGTIQTALETNNVTIDTGSTGTENGDISIEQNIDFSSSNTLTFNAAGNIDFVFGSSITGNDGTNPIGSVVFNSDTDGDGAGTTNLSLGTGVEAGSISFTGGGFLIENFDDLFEIRANSLEVEGGFTVVNSIVSFDVTNGNIDDLVVNAGSTLISDPPGQFTVGNLMIDHDPDGMVFGPTTLDGGTYTLTNGGTIDVSTAGPPQGQAALMLSADIINQGTLTVTGPGNIDIGAMGAGSLTNAGGATLNLEGGVLIATTPALVNNGDLNVSMSNGPMLEDLVEVIGEVENNNLVNINPGAVLEVTSFTSNQAELHLEGGGTLSLFDDGGGSAPIPVDATFGDGSSVTGDGIIATEGTVFFESGSTLAPGNSPGAVLIDGNATLFDGAILNIELAGPDPSEFDIVDVSGDLTVGGPGSMPAPAPGVVLNILNLDNYDPDPMTPHGIISVGGMVNQSATPFNESAVGFDTLGIAFNGNSLEAVVSVTPPAPPPPAPPPPAPPPPAPPPPAPPPPAPPPPAPPPPAPTPPAPTPPAPTPPAPTPPAPTPPAPTPPAPPVVEQPPMMELPDDIINDVLVIESTTTSTSAVDIAQGEEEEEIQTYATLCR